MKFFKRVIEKKNFDFRVSYKGFINVIVNLVVASHDGLFV